MSQNEWKRARFKRLACALPLETEQLINELIETAGKLSSVSGKVKQYRNLKLGVTARPIVREVLTKIRGDVSIAFAALSHINFV
jgi:hypothetical protein